MSNTDSPRGTLVQLVPWVLLVPVAVLVSGALTDAVVPEVPGESEGPT